MTDICGDSREVYETRHIFTRKLVDTQEEEETAEAQSTADNSTLSILKKTEEVLKTLSHRIEPQQKVDTTTHIAKCVITKLLLCMF